MKIAFISAMESHVWGGSEELWYGAARRLAASGHQVGACVKGWREPPMVLTTLRNEGVSVHERPAAILSPGHRIARRLGIVGDRRPSFEIWVEQFQPDLVCVSNGNYKDGLWCLEFLHRAGIPYSSIVQANAEFLWPSDDEADRLAAVYRNANRVYCVSEANRKLLEHQLAMRLPQSEVVRNPYQVKRTAMPSWPFESDIWRLACVARLEPDAKGQDLLFEVLSRPLWRDRPLRVSLFGSGTAGKGLQRLAEMFGLGDRVCFEGQVANMDAVWSAHHGLVLPSRYEGLPLALVEAMMCGRMAIVTDVAGNCEVIEDEVSGFVAKATTVDSLAEAMERAWAAREHWRQMGEVARDRVLRQVPVDPCQTLADKLVELL